MRQNILKYLNTYIPPFSITVYRIGFGILVMFSIIRFWSRGWIEKLYLEPDFHFTYLGFSWVQPLGIYTYLIFFICFLSALFVTIGYKYRFSIIVLFLSFTYIELMDKTTYLNHYYLISCISFLMIFLPASTYFSIDSGRNKFQIPKWSVDSIKILLIIVYLYAGLAKINSDWLIQAQPLKLWLKTKYSIPLIGDTLLQKEFIHYLFSWGGMLYDISIPFLLLVKRTRIFAFIMVIIFHVLTRILFPPIGMFPYIMIFSCIIFFDNSVHQKILDFISKSFKINHNKIYEEKILEKKSFINQLSLIFVCVFLFIQLVFPLRNKFYPGELLWTEQGYRFSWRVMLVEKTGYTTLKVVDQTNGKYVLIDNTDYLTEFQEKQMSFQSDFILEYAHYIGDIYKKKGFKDVAVYAESYVTINGRPSQLYIDPKINLYNKNRSLKNKEWIMPFKYDIKRFL